MNGVNTTDGITLYDSTLERHHLSSESTGELCDETETLTILNEFQRLYEARIKKVDRELEGEYERLSAKIQIMEEWIRDLGEQNIMLVHTVEDLEQTASIRVKLLEEKLQQSSLVVTDSITKSGSTEEAITSLSNHVSMVETDQEQLVEKIHVLKNDINGLLKLIERAWRDNNWYMDDISFIEIHPDEIIPAPLECPCDKEETTDRNVQSLKLKISQLEDHKKEMIESQAKLEKTVDHLSEELMAKEELVKRLQSNNTNFYKTNRGYTTAGYHQTDTGSEQYEPNVKDFQDILNNKDSMVINLKQQLQKTKNIVSMINQEKTLELSNLSSQLDKKCKECAKLAQLVCDIRKECEEYEQMQKISETEIQKRDYAISQLRKEITKLKDLCCGAKLNIDLKNDVIKEMRTVIKQLHCKDEFWPNENKVRLLVEEEGLQISNIKIEVERLFKNNNEYLNVTGLSPNAKNENVISDIDHHTNTYSKPGNSIMPSNENHGIDKCQLYNDIPFTRDIANTHQLLQTIETTIRSAQSGLEEITDKLREKETMKTISNTCDTLLLTSLIEKINKYKHELSNCPQELENLKHAFYSKDKLLSNLNEITKVQKDSITRMQTEINELGEKLQEKMKIHDQTIGEYEKEKIELIKQIELQTQTIGHLQNAVVDAKRNLDHLGRKAATDLEEKDQSIRISVMCAEEIERQYSECFTEAAEQNYVLELHRNAINDLQEQLRDMEDEKVIMTSSLHNAYYSIVDKLKGDLDKREEEFHDFKYKISLLVQSNTCLEDEELLSKLSRLIRDRENMKKELEKLNSNFYVLTEVLNIDQNDASIPNILTELQKIKKVEHVLHCENQRLKEDLESQTEEAKYLQKSLEAAEDSAKEYPPEVHETISCLQGRVKSLTNLLTEKSNEMAKLQADYEVIKNDNFILKGEIRTVDNKLNETVLKCQNLRNDHQRLEEELMHKDQKLTDAAKREFELQASLTETEKNYSSKLIATNERLQKLVDKLAKDLEIAQEKYTSKNAEMNQFHEMCNSYSEEINAVKELVGYERKKVSAIQQSNSSLKQKLKAAKEENYVLLEEKLLLQQNNSTIVTEWEEMQNSLWELKKKCLLKDESLANISAALTETAMSRTELCKESQYVVHCIRTWMEEQKNQTDKLTQSLKLKQEQLFQLECEKKRFLYNVRNLEDTNNMLKKKLRKALRCERIAKFTYANDSGDNGPPGVHASTPSCCNYARCMKVINISNNSANKPRRNTSFRNETYKNGEDSDVVLEESRDYGYQSCTSK